MLRSVAASYRAAGREVCVLALSAAAARVVTDETGIAATTIASWQHGTAALPSAGLVLVDEASMVPTLTLQQLTRAAKAKGCRVGLVGDYAQMGSPEAGGLLRDLAELPSARRLTTVRRFREPWERRASIELQARDQTTSINYFEHEQIVETTSDHAHADAAAAWFADHRTGLDTLVVTDTNHDAAHVAALRQEHLTTADRLDERLATGADGNPIHVGDQIQTRLNTSELATSDHRRVLNRDVWTVVGRRDDGTVTAVHAGSRDATVQLTADYLSEHTVLATRRPSPAPRADRRPRTHRRHAAHRLGVALRRHDAWPAAQPRPRRDRRPRPRRAATRPPQRAERVRRRRRPQPRRRDVRHDRPPTLGRRRTRSSRNPTARPRSRAGVPVLAGDQP
jgi:hypothetical protein